MVEADILTLIVAPIITGAISLVVIGVTRMGKNADTTLLGSADIRRLKEDFNELKERINRACERLDKNESRLDLHDYRINRIDKQNNNHNGDSR